MSDDKERLALIGQSMKTFGNLFHVAKIKSAGRFVKYDNRSAGSYG